MLMILIAKYRTLFRCFAIILSSNIFAACLVDHPTSLWKQSCRSEDEKKKKKLRSMKEVEHFRGMTEILARYLQLISALKRPLFEICC